MAVAAPTLAASQRRLAAEYDIVIVGSGYGGAVTAARLGCANRRAGGGLRIALLERGDERPLGSAPEDEPDLIDALRSPANPLGFYDIRRFDTIDVIQGCALGGTSLNNMNVAIVPDREVFQESWPAAICEEVERSDAGAGALEEYYGRARRMLGAIPWREGRGLPKAAVFDAIARHAGAEGRALDIAVSAEERTTRYGVRRGACVNCGDCCMGCNFGAKSSLPTNYLPMARHFGVDLFPRVEVDHVEAAPGGGYRLVCRVRSGPRGLKATTRTIAAPRVVLAAGSLGSTGILLRSRADGLALSARLGENFSGNGDNFGFAYNTDLVTDAQGFGTDTGERSEVLAGPSITSVMRFGADQRDLRKRFTVQDLTAPSALVDAFRLGLMGLAAAAHENLSLDKIDRWRRDLDWNVEGALNHSLGFLIMAHDSSDGQIVLDDDGAVRIDWPTAPDERIYREIDEVLEPAVEAIGGTYLSNPRWSGRFLGHNLITAHPLGGCATADSAARGVVDHAGRVFDPEGGVHPGLHVIDGAVIPRALGVNPLLTISMFAERAAEHLRRDLGLPPYDPATEADDRGRARGAKKRSWTARTGRGASKLEKRLERLRSLAARDRANAQEQTWVWIKELGAERDAAALAELFALGKPPRGLDGPTDGILVTMLVNPLVDLPVRLLTKLWMPWQGQIFESATSSGINRLAGSSQLPAKLIWPLYRMRDVEGGRGAFSFVSGVEKGKIEPEVQVLKIDYEPVASNPSVIIRQIRDELVEVVPDTHLGRILFRLPRDRFSNVGYFALRQPATS
jgi:cholesterol oxidase